VTKARTRTVTGPAVRMDAMIGAGPSAWRLAAARGAVELKTFVRERDTVLFTVALPVVLLLLLGAVYGRRFDGTAVTGSQYFAASMLAAGIVSTAFVNLATGIVSDREDGTLKRLRGVPMPPMAYFLGKVVLVAVVSVVEALVLLGVGVVAFGVRPGDGGAGDVLTLLWVFALGVATFGFLGIAASSLVRSVRAAAPAFTLPYLVLCFLSGIFVTPITALPAPLAAVGAVLPLKWLAQGFRSVLLPDEMQRYELAGQWELGRVALVLLAWLAVSVALSATTFRWRASVDG
jgi:ABC-2 type transport system permease protein